MQEYLFILVLLVFISRSLGLIGSRFKVQSIVGEVAGGLLVGFLGPLLLGFHFPSGPLTVLAQFGILILMFLAGLRTDFSTFNKNKFSALVVGALGVAASFIIVFLPLFMFFHLSLAASLFVSAVLSNTAIEVCAGILRNTRSERFRSVVLGAAFVDDVMAVFVLGIVSALVFSGAGGDAIIVKECDVSGPGLDGWALVPGEEYEQGGLSYSITTLDTMAPLPAGFDEERPMITVRTPDSTVDAAYLPMLESTIDPGIWPDGRVPGSISMDLELLLWRSGSAPVNGTLLFYVGPMGTPAPDQFHPVTMDMSDLGNGWWRLTLDDATLGSGNVSSSEALLIAWMIPVQSGNITQISIRSIGANLYFAESQDNTGDHSVLEILLLSLKVILFLVISLGLVTRIIDKLFDRIHQPSEKVLLTAALLLAFVMAIVARWVGLHEVIGVYIAGLMVGRWGGKVEPMLRRRIQFKKLISDIDPPIKALFSPLFFGYVGITLATSITRGFLEGMDLVGFLLLSLVILVAGFSGKIIGCGLGARLTGFSTMRSVRIGATMCGRGSLELVMLTYGLSSGIITNEIYTAMVFFTIISILLTPLLYLFSTRFDSDQPD